MFTNIRNKMSFTSFIIYVLHPLLLIILSALLVVQTICMKVNCKEFSENANLEYSVSCSVLKAGYSVRQIVSKYVRQECGVSLDSYESTKEDSEISSKEPLEGEQLYRQYISEIVDTCYPDLDKEIIAAIVYHESRFQPDSINERTAATGLMQILPKWHTKRAHKLGVTDLGDPYGNILVGCDILNELYQQKKSMSYALDFYAGGYKYADSYKNSVSPYRKELDEILESGVLGKE